MEVEFSASSQEEAIGWVGTFIGVGITHSVQKGLEFGLVGIRHLDSNQYPTRVSAMIAVVEK
jgi:hypothetical protein